MIDVRGIERAWRAGWMRAIARMLPGERSTELPTDRALTVLFVRYERIGDMIMAAGMIRALSTSPRVARLDVLANPTTRPVLEHNPHCGKIFTLDRKSWASYRAVGKLLREEKYDVIVDGRINNPPVFTSTPLLMLYARARFRVGVAGGLGDRVYNVRATAYDRATHYIEGSKALAAPFGIDVDNVDWRPEIFLTGTKSAGRTRCGSARKRGRARRETSA